MISVGRMAVIGGLAIAQLLVACDGASPNADPSPPRSSDVGAPHALYADWQLDGSTLKPPREEANEAVVFSENGDVTVRGCGARIGRVSVDAEGRFEFTHAEASDSESDCRAPITMTALQRANSFAVNIMRLDLYRNGEPIATFIQPVVD